MSGIQTPGAQGGESEANYEHRPSMTMRRRDLTSSFNGEGGGTVMSKRGGTITESDEEREVLGGIVDGGGSGASVSSNGDKHHAVLDAVILSAKLIQQEHMREVLDAGDWMGKVQDVLQKNYTDMIMAEMGIIKEKVNAVNELALAKADHDAMLDSDGFDQWKLQFDKEADDFKKLFDERVDNMKVFVTGKTGEKGFAKVLEESLISMALTKLETDLENESQDLASIPPSAQESEAVQLQKATDDERTAAKRRNQILFADVMRKLDKTVVERSESETKLWAAKQKMKKLNLDFTAALNDFESDQENEQFKAKMKKCKMAKESSQLNIEGYKSTIKTNGEEIRDICSTASNLGSIGIREDGSGEKTLNHTFKTEESLTMTVHGDFKSEQPFMAVKFKDRMWDIVLNHYGELYAIAPVIWLMQQDHDVEKSWRPPAITNNEIIMMGGNKLTMSSQMFGLYTKHSRVLYDLLKLKGDKALVHVMEKQMALNTSGIDGGHQRQSEGIEFDGVSCFDAMCHFHEQNGVQKRQEITTLIHNSYYLLKSGDVTDASNSILELCKVGEMLGVKVHYQMCVSPIVAYVRTWGPQYFTSKLSAYVKIPHDKMYDAMKELREVLAIIKTVTTPQTLANLVRSSNADIEQAQLSFDAMYGKADLHANVKARFAKHSGGGATPGSSRIPQGQRGTTQCAAQGCNGHVDVDLLKRITNGGKLFCKMHHDKCLRGETVTYFDGSKRNPASNSNKYKGGGIKSNKQRSGPRGGGPKSYSFQKNPDKNGKARRMVTGLTKEQYDSRVRQQATDNAKNATVSKVTGEPEPEKVVEENRVTKMEAEMRDLKDGMMKMTKALVSAAATSNNKTGVTLELEDSKDEDQMNRFMQQLLKSSD